MYSYNCFKFHTEQQFTSFCVPVCWHSFTVIIIQLFIVTVIIIQLFIVTISVIQFFIVTVIIIQLFIVTVIIIQLFIVTISVIQLFIVTVIIIQLFIVPAIIIQVLIVPVIVISCSLSRLLYSLASFAPVISFCTVEPCFLANHLHKCFPPPPTSAVHTCYSNNLALSHNLYQLSRWFNQLQMFLCL